MSSGEHGGRFDFHDSVRVHQPPYFQERHRGAPASAITTASPLVSLPAPWHSASTALATSSGGIRRRWPVVSRAARRASAGDMPVFAAMRLIDCRVMSVSTYPGQTALTVTPVPATSAATEPATPTNACFKALYAVGDLNRSGPLAGPWKRLCVY